MLKLQLSVTSSRRNLFSFEKKGKPFIQEYYQNINFQHNNTTVFQVQDMFMDIKFLLKISKFIQMHIQTQDLQSYCNLVLIPK